MGYLVLASSEVARAVTSVEPPLAAALAMGVIAIVAAASPQQRTTFHFMAIRHSLTSVEKTNVRSETVAAFCGCGREWKLGFSPWRVESP
jgi:hypothetical protein